ncbi:G-protein coupled receptor 4-like [Mugil cephalus]|uniref:G-protein coupled receptor 4-like n=1 Tax=Mugil cephalus TaxID=48193 RepID=UPI001FB80A6E|nr:G-protein coupled receptor 4-like [Mugil cephalus]
MNSTLPNQNTTTSWVLLYVCPWAYSLFFIVGFPANCLSLYVACMLIKNGNNNMAVYLITLSVSDLLYTITLPAWIEQSLQRPVHPYLCIFMNAIMYNSFYVGSGLLCCISVDRYLALVYPLYFNRIREVRTAAAVSAVVLALEIVIHTLLLDHTGALQDPKQLCKQGEPMTQKEADLALTRFILGFLVPVFIMTFCCQQIMRSLRRSSSIQTEERRKVELLLLFLLLTYVVSFAPYQIVMLLRVVLELRDSTWEVKLRDPYLVTITTTTLNSTLDPIIYCLISESAKKEIRKAAEKGKGLFMRKRSKGIQTVC